jgi:hypothetical protein
MAKSLRVTFEGLCEFVIRGSQQAEVYLPHGGGIHGQLLTIRSDFLEVPDAETAWMPTFVALIRDEKEAMPKQIGIWSLKGQDVTFKQTAATGAPKWKNRKFVIDFGVDHAGASVMSRNDIRSAQPNVGIVTVIGHETDLDAQEGGAADKFTLKKKSGNEVRTVSRLVHWETRGGADPEIFNRAGKKIVVRDGVNAWATISNAAAVSGKQGLTHFRHHYEGVKLAHGDEKMEIEHATERFANVFDCVPPTAWP